VNGRRRRSQAGFTLLEVLIATLIMGIAITGILSALSTASRGAARLTEYDRAILLARQKMDELLVDRSAPRGPSVEGTFPADQTGGLPAGWRSRISTFEKGLPPWSVDRVELEVWWMSGPTRRSFTLEGFRRSVGGQ
jgi:general secretion pathway protein I